jgi:hypothetical protein
LAIKRELENFFEKSDAFSSLKTYRQMAELSSKSPFTASQDEEKTVLAGLEVFGWPARLSKFSRSTKWEGIYRTQLVAS